MGDLKGLVLLFMLMAVTDITACKKKGNKIKQATAVRRDYLENPNFEKEYPQINISAQIDYPKELILPLNIYLSPSWRKMFPDQEGVTKAKEVLSYVKELFMSLSVKMLIVCEDLDIVPVDTEFEMKDLGEMEKWNFVPEPKHGRAAIVYLTSPLPDGWLGVAIERTICDENKRKSRSIVGWGTDSKLTAKTVVHEIGHIIGMSHDFDLPGPGWRDYKCGTLLEVGPENQLMNYNEPMESSWSSCSNDDFKEYYKRVSFEKGFCLKKPLGILFEQMDWGDNPYLVDESVSIQGREHIKLAVVMVGGTIDLECQVAFTREPVSKIRWKQDGRLINIAENQTEEIKNGEIFVEDHLKIVNITSDMDGSAVSCEYSKGEKSVSVETVFRVFGVGVDIPDKDCNTCEGYVKLTFKESRRTSPAEETVDEKIKAMIAEIVNVGVKEITVDDSGYSVNIPNPMKPIMDDVLYLLEQFIEFIE